MSITYRWRKEPGARVQGARPLDELKVQAPCIARVPGGGYRLFYTASGPAKPYATCQGYILSAFSRDGLVWERVGCAIEGGGYSSDELDAVHSEDMSLIEIEDGQYRMYYAACDRHGNWRIASARTEPIESL